ncbi:hypothetical protein ACTXMW_15350 [Brachybacterium paraconglomeratum]|uniref:hypothetical protein n=1 Tax=Brachybacterium paraconglomeratum TaxID=173362 RepID=UPI003FD427B3
MPHREQVLATIGVVAEVVRLGGIGLQVVESAGAAVVDDVLEATGHDGAHLAAEGHGVQLVELPSRVREVQRRAGARL